MDAAEAFRDLPGPRPARERPTGPDRTLELPDRRPPRGRRRAVRGRRPVRRGAVDPGAAGRRPIATGGRRRCARAGPDAAAVPPFGGGLVGFLGYDLGRRFERLPSIARVDQHLPALRLASTTGRSPGTAGRASRGWRHGRSMATSAGAIGALAEVRARVEALGRGEVGPANDPVAGAAPATFASLTPHDAWLRDVEAVRDAIERGDIYQANLTRRLEAPFAGDPWPVFRRLRTGDPALFAGYPRPRRRRPPPDGRARSSPRRPSPSCRSTARASSPPTRSRARAPAAAPGSRTARSPASCSRAPRTRPRT